MAASTAVVSDIDLQDFVNEYYGAWQGTDEDRVMSYFRDDVVLQMPGAVMNGKAAVLEQFVHPFMTAFPGNRHETSGMIFGSSVVAVEWVFKAEHKGSFAGKAATGAKVEVPGCSFYECDLVNRQIARGRLYFDTVTLLKQIGAA